jgi:hypothetical protein
MTMEIEVEEHLAVGREPPRECLAAQPMARTAQTRRAMPSALSSALRQPGL